MYKNPYELDLDENGMLKLSKKNAEFIYAIIKVDSVYRKTFDYKKVDSAYRFTKDNLGNIEGNYEVIKEICKRLDRESSTHIYTTGKKYKGKKTGLELTAEGIANKNGLIERLGEGDASLVKEISYFTYMNKFSFATKFCAYMCRFMFEGKSEQDNYVIYDDVLAKTLPYYEKYFLGTVSHKTKEGKDSIKVTYMDVQNYEGYRKYVDSIRTEVSKKYKYDLSREKFDYMIWYYYKGGYWKGVWEHIS